MGNRIPRISLIVILLLTLLPLPAGAAEEAPAISAEAAAVAELETGQVLYVKNGEKPMKAASTVKILTALIALERLDLTETVVIRPEWTGLEGSSMYLRPGQECTVSELLHGLLLVSGNDAALALACQVAGSEEAFVALMNERAAALGMKDSRFADASGLRSDGHWVTALDMLKLGCAAMRNPDFRAIVGKKTAEAAGQTLQNHNKLLWRCAGALGVKTGYTKAAGRTLVSCAEREGMTLVCVTLDDPDDWDDHCALLDWAFGAYARLDPAEMSWQLSVVSGEEAAVTAAPEGSERLLLLKEGVTFSVELPRFVYAPVKAGEQVGVLRILDASGMLIVEVPLRCRADVALDAAQKLNFWEKLRWAWLFACRHSAGCPQYVFF